MKNTNRQGTALIITLLIIGVLATLAFGIGQVFVSQVRITTSFEDSQGAYYAAQAGIEEGRRRYSQAPSAETNFNENLTKGSYAASVAFKKLNPDFGPIAKDDSFEIDTTSLNQLKISVTWPTITSQSKLQVLRVNSVSSSFDQSVYAITQSPQNITIPLNNTAKVRIKPLGGRVDRLTVDSGSTPVDSGTTTISSTGSYGKAKRKLEATFNRQNGTLNGIFDYVLLSQQSIQ